MTVAGARPQWEAAYRLVYETYRDVGYLPEDPSGLKTSVHLALPASRTFVALLDDRVIATVSLVPDGRAGLPMDGLYRAEVDALRSEGRRVAEVTGLADRRHFVGKGWPALLMLTRHMLHAALGQGMDDLVIAVNPRHRRFYTRMLQFEPLGPLRHYDTYAGQPALAYRLRLREVNDQQQSNPRWYAMYFDASPSPEDLEGRPMPADDVAHFLIDRTDTLARATPKERTELLRHYPQLAALLHESPSGPVARAV